jgi:hypothetical protein
MNGSGQSTSLTPWIILVLVLAWVVYRRTRPQRVRLTRTYVYTAVIVLASVVALTANRGVLETPLFLGLAPVALIVGVGLGWLMMRTIRFWRDGQSGDVWMSGGVAYVGIWLLTLVVRFGVEYAATGSLGTAQSSGGERPVTPLSILASDLLLLSVGLWLARGWALARHYRDLVGAQGWPSNSRNAAP